MLLDFFYLNESKSSNRHFKQQKFDVLYVQFDIWKSCVLFIGKILLLTMSRKTLVAMCSLQ